MSGDSAAGRRALDLEACAREPIHVPGSIQPHGVLIEVSPAPERVVVRVSANTLDVLGLAVDRVLGAPLAELVDGATLAAIAGALDRDDPNEPSPLPVVCNGRAFDGIAHRHLGATIVELEPVDGGRRDDVPRRLIGALGLVRRAGTLDELFHATVEEIRALTGFDRALVYRFDVAGDGEVIAESRDDQVDSYLGLHYPASDIPRQARELYLVNWLRIIPDAVYEPAPLVARAGHAAGAPLDLTHAVLRSVSPVHLEYMANMGVRASMSVSLVVDGQLWGLVSCNHRTPRKVPYETRVACELIARVVSLQIAAMQEIALRARRDAERATLSPLVDAMRAAEHPLSGLAARPDELLALVGASGAVIVAEGRTVTIGAAPAGPWLAACLAWIAEPRRAEVAHTSELGAAIARDERAPAEASVDVAGVLGITIPTSPPSQVVWLRPEVARTVSWAGDPTKTADGEPGERLHPRRSFALWKETVRGRSLPWDAIDVEVAAELRRAAIELDLARQVRRADAARDEARAAHARMAYLARASSALAHSLDAEQVATTLAQLASEVGDLAVLHLVDERGARRRARIRHADPTKQALAERLHRYAPVATDVLRPAAAGASGRSVCLASVDRATIDRIALDDEHANLLWSELAIRSFLSVPIVARTVRGSLSIARAAGRTALGPPDVAVAEELARRGAAALDNAGLYGEAQAALGEQLRAVRARDDIVAIVSHDLKNPLGAIKLHAGVIERGLAAGAERLPERLSTSAARIQRSCERMETLLRDLLDQSKIDAGRFHVDARPEAAAELLAEVLGVVRPLAEAKGIEVRAEIEDACEVMADRDRIFQVLSNLVGNAVKFTATGGTITVAVRRRGDRAQLSVSDTGSGIAPDDLPHLFDRYWQARHGAHGGSGLGLYIVKGIVDAHHGRVWVESEPGRGTTVYFTLPCAAGG